MKMVPGRFGSGRSWRSPKLSKAAWPLFPAHSEPVPRALEGGLHFCVCACGPSRAYLEFCTNMMYDNASYFR